MKTAMMLGLLAIGVEAGGSEREVYPIDLSAYAHGQVLNGADLNTAFATVDNFHSDTGLLVAFDTAKGDAAAAGIPGLGDLAHSDLGTVLMIQDTGPGFAGFSDIGQTRVRKPAPEQRGIGGDAPGVGEITLSFANPIRSIGFTLVGFEATESLENRSASHISFTGGGKTVMVAFADFVDPASPFHDPDVAFGQGSINPIQRIDVNQLKLERIEQVVINLGAPGAVGGLNFEILDGGWDPGGPGDFTAFTSGAGQPANITYPQQTYLPGILDGSAPGIRSGIDGPDPRQPPTPEPPLPPDPLPPGGGGGSVVPTPSAAIAVITTIGGMMLLRRRR